VANARPSSTRAAGAGGSSSTMLSECDVFFGGGCERGGLVRGVLEGEGRGGREGVGEEWGGEGMVGKGETVGL